MSSNKISDQLRNIQKNMDILNLSTKIKNKLDTSQSTGILNTPLKNVLVESKYALISSFVREKYKILLAIAIIVYAGLYIYKPKYIISIKNKKQIIDINKLNYTSAILTGIVWIVFFIYFVKTR